MRTEINRDDKKVKLAVAYRKHERRIKNGIVRTIKTFVLASCKKTHQHQRPRIRKSRFFHGFSMLLTLTR